MEHLTNDMIQIDEVVVREDTLAPVSNSKVIPKPAKVKRYLLFWSDENNVSIEKEANVPLEDRVEGRQTMAKYQTRAKRYRAKVLRISGK
jgi:hypothetical protein